MTMSPGLQKSILHFLIIGVYTIQETFFSVVHTARWAYFSRTVPHPTVSADAGREPRTVAMYALTGGAANHISSTRILDRIREDYAQRLAPAENLFLKYMICQAKS
jgi:hypothetical protein